MSISGINSSVLQAVSAYSNSNVQKSKLPDASSNVEFVAQNNIQSTGSFQKMVNKNFNSFANMSPDQIMAFSKVAQNAATSHGSNNSIISQAFSSIPNAIRKDEEVKKRALVNEASMTKVIAATSEAKVVLQTAVAVRNKMLDAFEKIMNMPI